MTMPQFATSYNGICHDRRLTFAAAKMGGEIIPGLLESIHKATSERREYGKGKKAVHGSGGKARV